MFDDQTHFKRRLPHYKCGSSDWEGHSLFLKVRGWVVWYLPGNTGLMERESTLLRAGTGQSHQSDESRVFMIQPKARVCTDWISKIDTDNYSFRWWDFFFLFWRTVTQWLPKGGDPITWSSKSENYHLKPKSAFCEMLYNVGAKFWNVINSDGLK